MTKEPLTPLSPGYCREKFECPRVRGYLCYFHRSYRKGEHEMCIMEDSFLLDRVETRASEKASTYKQTRTWSDIMMQLLVVSKMHPQICHRLNISCE